MASASENDLRGLLNLSFTFVENYLSSKNKASGEKSQSKGCIYYAEKHVKNLRGEFLMLIK